MSHRARQRGEVNFGCLFGLVLLALALFVAYKMVPVKIRAADLKQTIEDEAKSAGTHNDDRIQQAILDKAKEQNLPVTAEDVKIKREHGEISVDVEYTVPIDFPGYVYPWHQHIVAQNPIF